MANTGQKGFVLIEQYYTDDNSTTGVSKDNACYLPEYVPPVYDAVSCPVINSTIELDVYSLSVGLAGDYRLVQVTSNYDDLVFSCAASWIALLTTGNQNNVELEISVVYNYTGYSRVEYIYIYNGTDYLTAISVEQGS